VYSYYTFLPSGGKMEDNNEMMIEDEVVGQIAKLVQLAILTGTDVVDNLRMMRLQINEENGRLCLSDSYREQSENQVKNLLDKLDKQETVE